MLPSISLAVSVELPGPHSLLRREEQTGKPVVRQSSTGNAPGNATKGKNGTNLTNVSVPCNSGQEYWDPDDALVVSPCEPRPPQRNDFPDVGPKGKPRPKGLHHFGLIRMCEVFPDTRLVSQMGQNEINNLYVDEKETVKYGEIKKSREECFALCKRIEDCQQVVWHKLTNACYLMKAATQQGYMKQGHDAEFDSAVCGARACRPFDNYRKGGTGLPLDHDPVLFKKRHKTEMYEPLIPPHMTTRPPHLDGYHPHHETPFRAHAFRVGSYNECETWCIENGECKQAVYDKMDKLCELWTGRSNAVDSDGWPGKNKLYKSAACGSRVCDIYLNTKKAVPSKYNTLRLEVSKGHPYGAETATWEDCLKFCISDYHCLQTVFDSHTRKCYPLAAAVEANVPIAYNETKRYHSAHCFLSDEGPNLV